MSSALSQDRQVTQLPTALLELCTTYLEEQVYNQAFSTLSNALVAYREDGSIVYRVPPPQHFALAATLSIHPRLTTRARRQDKLMSVDGAMRYLRLVSRNVGPRSAGFRESFRFTGRKISRARGTTRDSPGETDSGPTGAINHFFARKQALWSNAENFWSLVGWAFNCSVVHPARWKYYKVFLSLLSDILDDDLEESISKAPPGDVVHGETLIAQYLAAIGEGRANRRKVLRAILADGRSKSLSEFGEIWPGETREAKRKDEKVFKQKKLDLDNHEYGDYLDSCSENEYLEDEAPSRAQLLDAETDESEVPLPLDDATVQPAKSADSSTHTDSFGGIEALQLRQKFIATLVRLSEVSPSSFLDTEDLFDLLTEFLRPLPLLVFQQFVAPVVPYLSAAQQASLNEMLLWPLSSVSGANSSPRSISQTEFQARYAGLTAVNSSAVDNARVSMLVESLLRALWKSDSLEPTDALRLAVIHGIEARAKRVKKATKTAEMGDVAEQMMHMSAKRIEAVVEMISV